MTDRSAARSFRTCRARSPTCGALRSGLGRRGRTHSAAPQLGGEPVDRRARGTEALADHLCGGVVDKAGPRCLVAALQRLARRGEDLRTGPHLKSCSQTIRHEAQTCTWCNSWSPVSGKENNKVLPDASGATPRPESPGDLDPASDRLWFCLLQEIAWDCIIAALARRCHRAILGRGDPHSATERLYKASRGSSLTARQLASTVQTTTTGVL